jgi:hypothetical protein
MKRLFAGAALAPAALALAAPAPALAGPQVTVVILPAGTGPRAIESAGLSPGLLSAGIGSVPAAQTYLDAGQGNRIFDSLYDGGLPRLARRGGRIEGWPAVLARADSAPADIVPGLLASALAAAVRGTGGTAIEAAPGGLGPALLAAGQSGRFSLAPPGCAVRSCRRPVLVLAAGTGALPGLVRRLRGRDLLIAFARPPPAEEHQLAVGIAGSGFDGNLTSDSTRTGGYVLVTDLAPTILARFGLPPPDAMSGEPIRSEGSRDAAALLSLDDRMAEIQPRRARVIGGTILIWAALAGLAAALGGRRAARRALPLLALSVVLLPALLLLTSALRPGAGAEWLIVGLGAPALAALILRLLPGYAALAVACGVTVLAEALDVILGSPLTSLSLIGPNPGLGVRFYGIGNELEAVLAPLTIIGTGAAITAFAPRLGRRAGAIAFLASGLLFALVFAAGRFGADVGAAIVFPAGAAVAAAVFAGSRRTALLALAAPLLALAALALIDLLSGGNAHLTRSVLDAGGLHDLADVAERRLRLSAHSFARRGNLFFAAAVLVLAVLGWRDRERLLAWFDRRPAARAAFAGALAATVVGTLANDSGALLLEVGAAYLLAFLAFAWAQAPEARRERA